MGRGGQNQGGMLETKVVRCRINHHKPGLMILSVCAASAPVHHAGGELAAKKNKELRP